MPITSNTISELNGIPIQQGKVSASGIPLYNSAMVAKVWTLPLTVK
jgi:hypothetical protein